MFRSTTVVGVQREGTTAIAADGQVTFNESVVVKSSARKVHKLAGGSVVCGFAGSVADAQSLLDKFEGKLDSRGGSLKRAAVEFAKEWRTDRVLRHLNAMIIAADGKDMLLLSGDGNVLEPDGGVAAIGSGGPFALAAGRALMSETKLGAEEIARKALGIAAEICVYTNEAIQMEVLQEKKSKKK